MNAESQTTQRHGTHLPSGWRWTRLGEMCEIIAGQSPPGDTYRDEPSGLPFFQGKADFGSLNPVPRKWCVEPGKIAELGDILISVRAPVGPTNVADTRCCIGRGLAAIRPGAMMDRDYVLFALRHFESDLAALGSGSTFSAISRRQLETLALPSPPLREQKRIAAALRKQLSAAARMRAAAAMQVAATETLVESELRDAFRGITPLAVGSVRDAAPEGWKWHLLLDLARLESGHTPSRRHPEWWGGDIPWLALPDIRELDCQVADETTETTNEQGIANSSARVLPAGTVVLSRTASVGFVAMMGRPMATSQDFVNWVCGPDLDPSFLMYLLRASRNYIRQLSSGAIHKTVYVPTVKAFTVCVPQVTEQKRIASKVRSRRAAHAEIRVLLNDQAAQIDCLPSVFLRQAFSGAA